MTAAAHLDVLIVGAGLSGIDMAYRLQTACPGKSYTILETRDAIGGTWDLFRYPGVRSDSDMHTLGFPFRPWSGAQAIADGGAIRDYIAHTAYAFGIDRRIRFGHRVTRAAWSSDKARWTLEVETDDGPVRLTCGFLYMGCGYYDYAAGYTPRFDGIEEYRGRLVHPQHWPDDLDYTGKQVVVIGSGATAVTLTPAIARRAAHVVMLQRSPSYIFALPGKDGFAAWARRLLPHAAADRATRWKNILLGMAAFAYARRRPDRAKALMLKGVRAQLPDNYEIERDFEPRYAPWDQRICLVPDADLFVAIRSGKASVVTDRIDRFTATGLRLASGRELAADIVVTATGLVLKLFGGVALSVDGRPVVPADHLSYKGMMFSNLPNLALAFGYTNASWTLKCDLSARYACRLLDHMDRHGFTTCVPRLRDPDVKPEPLVAFTSGYIKRAEAILPHQGSKAPWRVYQNYALDLAAMTLGSVDDGVMEFSMAKAANHTKPAGTRSASAPLAAAGATLAAVAGLALFSKLSANRIERRVPPDGRFVEVDGVRLHYTDQGSGPAIVMIHGLGGQIRNFSYALTDRLAGDHRLVLVDRPGSGYSAPLSRGRANVRAQAALIAGFLDALGLDRPLVVGHSLGGAVALALALDHPGKVGELALIAPLTHPDRNLPDAFKNMAAAVAPVRRAWAWTLAVPTAMLMGRKVAELVFAPDPVPADFPTRGGGALAIRPGGAYGALGDFLAAHQDIDDLVRRYPTLSVPVAIVFGRGDRVLAPAAHGEALAAAVPGAELTMMEGGHMIPVTRPDEIAAWLRAVEARVRR